MLVVSKGQRWHRMVNKWWQESSRWEEQVERGATSRRKEGWTRLAIISELGSEDGEESDRRQSARGSER